MEPGLHFERGPVCHLARTDYCDWFYFWLDAWYAQRHDYHAVGGLRFDGRGEGPEARAYYVYVRGPQCHFAKYYRVRTLAGVCGKRLLADRDRFLVSWYWPGNLTSGR